MYIHAAKFISAGTEMYPTWMRFRENHQDPLYQYLSIVDNQKTHLGNELSAKTSLFPTYTNYGEDIAYSVIHSVLSGTYIGDGNPITSCLNTADFLSPIPTRATYQETISLAGNPEGALYSVCCLDTISGEFIALAHSGMYTYNLSGALIDSNVYNLVEEEGVVLEFDPYGRFDLTQYPLSGTFEVIDTYTFTRSLVPNSQFVLSGSMLYAKWVSGVYQADYQYLVYENGAKVKTTDPNYEISNPDANIYMGVRKGESSVSVPFDLKLIAGVPSLVVDPRLARPGRSARVDFDYYVHNITTWADSRFDKRIMRISGETLLPDSVRVYSTGASTTDVMYMLNGNLYESSLVGSTPLYLQDEIEVEETPFDMTLLSGTTTAGTIYVSYYSLYTKSYEVSGMQSYYPSSSLTTSNYPTEYTIENGIVFPKTIFTPTDSLGHIYREMKKATADKFRLFIPQDFSGVCKRFGSNELWSSTSLLNAYENAYGGREIYLSTSSLETDVVPIYSTSRIDDTWQRCYLSGSSYSLQNPGGGLIRYYKHYPFANFDSVPFSIIGMLSVGRYILFVLYKNSSILLVYYDPDRSEIFDLLDVVEIPYTLTSPKDSFLYDNKLYILDGTTLKVFRFSHDYMISYRTRTLFRENYSQVVG